MAAVAQRHSETVKVNDAVVMPWAGTTEIARVAGVTGDGRAMVLPTEGRTTSARIEGRIGEWSVVGRFYKKSYSKWFVRYEKWVFVPDDDAGIASEVEFHL